MWNHRQHHCRRMLHIVINMLFCYRHLSRNSKRSTGIQIPIILGKGTRTYLQANTMPSFEYLTGVPAINREFINPPRLYQGWSIHTLTETRSYHAITEALDKT